MPRGTIEDYKTMTAKALASGDIKILKEAARDLGDVVARSSHEELTPQATALIDKLSELGYSAAADDALLNLTRSIAFSKSEALKVDVSKCAARFANKVFEDNQAESPTRVGPSRLWMTLEEVGKLSSPDSVEGNYVAQLKQYCGNITQMADIEKPLDKAHVEALKVPGARSR